MRNLFESIVSFWKDLAADSSFFVFVLGVVLILAVGVIDEGYNSKYNKAKEIHHEIRQENIFHKKIIESQKDTIEKQRLLIDELLKRMQEEKKGKIYAKI